MHATLGNSSSRVATHSLWGLQWAGNVFIMIAGSPEIRFVDSPCCLAWLVAVAVVVGLTAAAIVVVVVVGSAYERGNLLISTAPSHVAYEWWLNSYQLTVYLHQAPSLPTPKAKSPIPPRTHKVSLSLSLPPTQSLFFLCVAVWYEKLTVIYAIMLTKYLLGRSSSSWLP